ILNKIAVVELGPDGSAGVTSYLGLFSPARQSYEIEVQGGGLLAPLNPGYNPWGPGGPNTPGEAVFVQSEPSRVRGLSVNQWSMQTFMTEGRGADWGRIVSHLQGQGEGLVGTLRNETDQTLTDAVLVLGNRLTRLGDLLPGEEISVTVDLSHLDGRYLGPIGWRLFEEQLSQPGPGGPPRDAQLRQTVVDSIFEGGGRLGPFSSLSFAPGGSSPQGLVLLGWLVKAPPELRVGGRKPTQQATALLITSLPFHLPEEGKISLPPGLVAGALVEMPAEGGPCGPGSTSVFIGWGQAVFDFQMPEGMQNVQVEELKLVIESDGGWAQPPDTAIYDWDAETWRELDDPVMGVNLVTDAAGLFSDDGLARVRLFSESGRGGGCLFLELGLEGKR
ncbi:MAG: hypothetical protein JSV36_07795, partial [Anaerolineae bacterium]